ncbi:MAG: DUF4157 domain-containing protein [Leptonema illini]|uniref:DUF4157 domain-containing protein n=1 Tax=Leptonema illini TaxID=183 RepID=A0A833M0U9_9LEPT|nr:MAG: DUF4157 domain-containing protein [Leptonema illini]
MRQSYRAGSCTAEEPADSIGAKALAKGNDVVFAKDEYNRGTSTLSAGRVDASN